MFEWYSKSIIFYMFIMCCSSIICTNNAKKNGWIEDANVVGPSIEGFINLFCLSAVPIVRFLVVLSMFVAATFTKEQLEEWTKKLEEDDELVDLDDCEVHYYEDLDEHDGEDCDDNN